jgi:uncharacterized lipoprotein YmbA
MKGEKMRTIPHMTIRASLLVFLLLFISGCASTEPSRFYTLNSIKSSDTVQQSSPHELLVMIGPVEIPDYLDRPQIVSRTSQNEVTFSEFQRWAGSLKDDITRVLSEDLTELLSEDAISVSPWEWGTQSDYRVSVHIRRFDIMPEGTVLLNARCTIIGADGMTQLLMWETSVSEPIHEQTYDAKVSSMSEALEKLSKDIAKKIREVSQEYP